MRRIVAAAAAAFIVAARAVGAHAFQNEPTGFRGVPWGTPIGQAHGLYILDHAAGDRRSYRRSFEDLSVNGIPLQAIYFDFYQGRFEEAVLIAKRNHGADLLATLTARYGEPARAKGRKRIFVWSGTVATVEMTCSGRFVTCTVAIASNAIMAEDRAGLAASARHNDKDF